MDTISRSLREVLHDTWPMIALTCVVLITLRLAYLIKNKQKFIVGNELMMLTFIVYILCLFQVVTLQDINLTNGNNFIPFSEILRYKFGSRLFVKNIFGNVIMFVPYGFFLGKYAVQKNYKVAFFLILIASLSIELTQLLIGRIFDIAS